MLFTLLVGIAAGVAVKPLLPNLTELLIRAVGAERLPGTGDRKVFAFAAVMIGAALVLWVLGVRAAPVPLLCGALAGYFQQEIRDALIRRS